MDESPRGVEIARESDTLENMKKLALVGVLLAVSVPAMAATELARVNTSVITLEEFNKKYRENLKFFQFKAPTKKGVLDDLIKRELGIQEAKKMGLDKDPEVVDRMNTVLYHALLDKKLNKDFESIKTSDSDAQDFYDKNPEIRTSHVFVGVASNATPQQQKEALDKIQKIYNEQIKPGKASFAETAIKFSEGTAAPMGGDIDYQFKDKLDPAYYEAARKLKVGQVSGVVRTQFGYHIIKLTSVRPWSEVDRGQVKRMLFDDKRNQIFEKYMDQLRAQSKVNVKNDLIRE